jgi:hypothetical protein
MTQGEPMKICPNPIPWNDVFTRLQAHASTYPCVPPMPPKPLILAGWAYSNDTEKLKRWEQTVSWADANGCPSLVVVADKDFYLADNPTSYRIGPLGGPLS